jgi:hypothetical protein
MLPQIQRSVVDFSNVPRSNRGLPLNKTPVFAKRLDSGDKATALRRKTFVRQR